MKTTILSTLWWKAALTRALRTVLVVAVPYFGGVTLIDFPWLALASAAGFAFIASLVTSLAGLPELGDGAPWWLGLLQRVVKTFAQALAAGWGTAVLIQEVEWSSVLQAALIAAAGSLLIGLISKLPEHSALIDATSTDGVPVVTSLPSTQATVADDKPAKAATDAS